MTGFQHLMLSSFMIAMASLMSINYDQWSEDANWKVLVSLQGVCENEDLRHRLPRWFDCGRYEELRELDRDSDARIHRLRQTDNLPQIGDDALIDLPG